MTDKAVERLTDETSKAVCLKCGHSTIELKLNQIEQFVMAPEVIRIPNAPDKIKGLMEYGDGLIVLLGLEPEGEDRADAPACAAVIRREDGGLYGILADEIVGGICDTI